MLILYKTLLKAMNYNIHLPTAVPQMNWTTRSSYMGVQGNGIRCQMKITLSAGEYAEGTFEFVGVFRTSSDEQVDPADYIKRAESSEAAALLYDVAVDRIRKAFSEELLCTLLPEFSPNPYV